MAQQSYIVARPVGPVWKAETHRTPEELIEQVALEGVNRLIAEPTDHTRQYVCGLVRAAADRKTARNTSDMLGELIYLTTEVASRIAIRATRLLAAHPELDGDPETLLRRAAADSNLESFDLTDVMVSLEG